MSQSNISQTLISIPSIDLKIQPVITQSFKILNPQILPQGDQFKKHLQQISKAKNLTQFSQKILNWSVYSQKNGYPIKNLIVKLSQSDQQLNQLKGKNNKYNVQFFPIYKKFTWKHNFDFKNFQGIISINKFTKDFIKQFQLKSKYSRIQKSFAFGTNFKFYYPWQIDIKRIYGVPISDKWVFDSNQANFKYHINKQSLTNQQKLNFNDSINFKFKGYQPRLNRNKYQFIQKLYKNKNLLKTVDTYQVGYYQSRTYIPQKINIAFQSSIGSDFNSIHYAKIKSRLLKRININQRFILRSYSQFCGIFGNNLSQFQMFSRNSSKFMGQRSKIYAHQRFDLYYSGIQPLKQFSIIPSNYLSFWTSKNSEGKIKLQSQFGICFTISNTLKFDVNLMNLSGIKGQPRFGLKFDF